MVRRLCESTSSIYGVSIFFLMGVTNLEESPAYLLLISVAKLGSLSSKSSLLEAAF